MFAALIEATPPEGDGRKVGDCHTVIAVVDGDEHECVSRAIAELKARGWSAIDVRRVGPVVAIDKGSAPSYISGAVADAEESGFGFVVYERPIRSN